MSTQHPALSRTLSDPLRHYKCNPQPETHRAVQTRKEVRESHFVFGSRNTKHKTYNCTSSLINYSSSTGQLKTTLTKEVRRYTAGTPSTLLLYGPRDVRVMLHTNHQAHQPKEAIWKCLTLRAAPVTARKYLDSQKSISLPPSCSDEQ
jgi:hypothetical protein